MRIVGGEFRGRVLHAPPGRGVRPTSERVREAIFNILSHGVCDPRGARVIDSFAGTGAFGLEALSRGAEFALFVDNSETSLAALGRNIVALKLTERTKIFRRDAAALSMIPAGVAPFSLAFLDPPYGLGLLAPALQSLLNGGWLVHGACIVLEMRAQEEISPPRSTIEIDTRFYGETKIKLLTIAVPGQVPG